MKAPELIRFRWLLGTLLIAAAALFAVGIATEGDVHRDRVAGAESTRHDEATERAEAGGQAEIAETGERILGINLESTPLVVLAVVLSVGLAVATWRRDHRLVLLAAAAFAAGFAVLDVAEFSHQLRRTAGTIALIAATIAVLHAAATIAVLHAAAALLAEQRRTATA